MYNAIVESSGRDNRRSGMKAFDRAIPFNYHERYFLPLAIRLFNICCPFGSFSRARKPCLRFCTLLDGVKVLLGAPTAAEAEKLRICIDDRIEVVNIEVVVGNLAWEVIESAEKVCDKVVVRGTSVALGVILDSMMGCLRIVLKALHCTVSTYNLSCPGGLFVPATRHLIDSGWHRVKDAFDDSSTDATHIEWWARKPCRQDTID